jgi:hypothetical protein
MQNLTNITSAEVVVAGSALLILCVTPSLVAWSDARRRRKAVAAAAAREALAAAAERAALAAAAAPLEPSPPLSLLDPQQLWDEPTATVAAAELDAAQGVPAAVEAPAAVPPPVVASPVALDEVPAPPAEVLAPPDAATESVAAPAADAPHFQFRLDDLRRVRLADWPPAEVQDDPARHEAWRNAEQLAAERQRDIGALLLDSPQPAQSSCLGSVEAAATGTRLRFLLFPALWPTTAEQATAEAVFEIDSAGGEIRTWVTGRAPSH